MHFIQLLQVFLTMMHGFIIMPDINANNEMPKINLMILMQSNKQIDPHITINSCVAVEHFTYLASELSCETTPYSRYKWHACNIFQ